MRNPEITLRDIGKIVTNHCNTSVLVFSHMDKCSDKKQQTICVINIQNLNGNISK